MEPIRADSPRVASSAQRHTSEGSHHHRTREQAPLWQMAKNHESSLSPSLSLWHNGNTRSSHEVTETFSHFSPEGISASFLKMAEAGHSHPLSSCRGGRDDYLRKKAVPSHCLLLLRRFQKRNIERSGQALGDGLPCHRGKRQVWVVGAEKEPCEKEVTTTTGTALYTIRGRGGGTGYQDQVKREITKMNPKTNITCKNHLGHTVPAL